MDLKSLKSELSENYSKSRILQLASLAANGELEIQDIITLCFDKNPQVAFRASWMLEYTEIVAMDDFKICLKEFLELYPTVKNLSVQRHFTKILMRLTHPKFIRFYGINVADLEIQISETFNWLVLDSTPLAVKCNCMDILYQVYNCQGWIQDELKAVLENYVLSDSPALKSRAKRVLKRFNSK